MASQAPQLYWDAFRQEHFYWSPQENCYVTQETNERFVYVNNVRQTLSLRQDPAAALPRTPQTPTVAQYHDTNNPEGLLAGRLQRHYPHASGATRTPVETAQQTATHGTQRALAPPEARQASGGMHAAITGTHLANIPVAGPSTGGRTRAGSRNSEAAPPLNKGMRRTIRATPGRYEKLDKNYERRKDAASFFCFGRVFRILWFENPGNTKDNATLVSAHYGEQVFAKIRWFVVIREDGNNERPIQTYGGRGVSKFSTEKSEHAIVYTGATAPQPLPGEQPARGESPMRPPIRVKQANLADKLDPISRIHFARVYTVEHNVKVLNFGKVHADSLNDLRTQFMSAWMNWQTSTKTTPTVQAGPSRLPTALAVDVLARQFQTQLRTQPPSAQQQMQTQSQVQDQLGNSAQPVMRRLVSDPSPATLPSPNVAIRRPSANNATPARHLFSGQPVPEQAAADPEDSTTSDEEDSDDDSGAEDEQPPNKFGSTANPAIARTDPTRYAAAPIAAPSSARMPLPESPTIQTQAQGDAAGNEDDSNENSDEDSDEESGED